MKILIDDNDGDTQFKYGIIISLVSLISFLYVCINILLTVLFEAYLYEDNTMLLIKCIFNAMILL